MIARALFALAAALFVTVAASASDRTSDTCTSELAPTGSSVESRILLAQNTPPMPNCKEECSNYQKCTPGPCKRVGDEMRCEPEVCKTEKICRWVCPSK